MTLFHNVTRGGQVHMHQLRMIRQVLWFALLIALITSLSYVSFKAYHHIQSWQWQTLWEYHVAELNVSTQPPEKQAHVKQRYYPPHARPYLRSSLSILKDHNIGRVVTQTEQYLMDLVQDSAKMGLYAFLSAILAWSAMGYRHRRKKQHRGNTLVPMSTLARRLRWTFKASDLKLGKLPLVKNSETSHILLSGTTGSGKSNAFHTLLPKIRSRGNAAILVDIEGDMVARYFRPKRDILLNPFDQRGRCWDLWAELERESLYQVFAQAVVPPLKDVRDKLWENAARKILIAALRKFKQQGWTSPLKLYEQLVYSNPKEFEMFFQGTDAATFAQEKGEKLTLSVRASLEQYLDFFKYLPDPQGQQTFCIRNWVKTCLPQENWLFFSATEEDRHALLPLLSGWSDLAMSALMSLPKDYRRRLWLVLDELPALNALPCLMNSLARARKYGGCVLAGVQNFKQLDLTYGRVEAEVLIDLFNTKVFFKSTENSTAEWVSKTLGEREETEVVENLSYGANTTRDGVSLNQQTKRTPLVIPTEVMMLRDLEAFIKLSGSYPVVKGKFPLVKTRDIAPQFIPK